MVEGLGLGDGLGHCKRSMRGWDCVNLGIFVFLMALLLCVFFVWSLIETILSFGE